MCSVEEFIEQTQFNIGVRAAEGLLCTLSRASGAQAAASGSGEGKEGLLALLARQDELLHTALC